MMFFIPTKKKKSRKRILKRGKKRVSVPLRRRVLSSLRSLSLSRLLVCAPLSFFLSLSLSLCLCLLFFCASKNLSFFCEEQFRSFFGLLFCSRTEKETKFWIGHLHTTSRILLSPPFVYLFTEHTALPCTPHHQRQDARLLLKSLL